MSMDAVKKQFALRRKLRKKRQREKKAGRTATGDGGLAAGGLAAGDRLDTSVGADLIAVAAGLEELMGEDETVTWETSLPGDARDPPRDLGPEPTIDLEDGAVRKAREELDDMRKLWRRMRRVLPRMPALPVKKLRKDDLAAQLLAVIGVGQAPLPAWGCPEGIDAYMERLTDYLTPLAGARRCSPDALEFPLGTGRWDEDLVFALLLSDPSEPPPRAERLKIVLKLSRT